ncbi:MAG TPA: M23 family metallopeptidase [Thermodesulfobacteriota bacterium]|nr:M23 family metallopeptidase [Deltaproteobacteria bacterium]HNR13062.1 M23 family metallopeptidase [Thermodesulfobacteriota bacterium]HNU70507.1 M23 family metallopeptidase [Thermodesulfobacteriota bacterium]
MHKLFLWTLLIFCALVFVVVTVGDNESYAPAPQLTESENFILEGAKVLERGLIEKEEVAAECPSTNTVCGIVQSGQSFYSIMCDQGFSPLAVHHYIDAFKEVLNCGKLSTGDEYRIVTDDTDNLVSCTIIRGPVDVFTLCHNGENLVASKEAIALEQRVVQVQGTIKDSVFGAVLDAGEREQLAIKLADIFAWDIDFRHDLHRDDKFTIILEKYYKDDELVCYGNILAVEFKTQQRVHRAIFFRNVDGHEDYYTPEGYSIRRCFLRSPLRFTRISSGYSKQRFHPILKTYRPHLGVDFAAPTGTPVWAVADGVVTFKGWKSGNGNTVTIRHPGGYETMYNHLSRYGKNISRGTSVRQKDIIGYVGTTGLSTGPHLDYRMKKNGVFINPLQEKFPFGMPIPEGSRQVFLQLSKQMIACLESDKIPSSVMMAEARSDQE